MNEPRPRFSEGAAPQAGIPPLPVDPADANLGLEWIELCDKVGFTVVVVEAPYSPALWQKSGFEECLEVTLGNVGLGHLDSVKYGNPIKFFFYVPSARLQAGLQLMHNDLYGRGLLPHVKIGYADKESKTWRRVVFPEEGGAAA